MTTDTIEISAAALNYDTERQILARALLETDRNQSSRTSAWTKDMIFQR